MQTRELIILLLLILLAAVVVALVVRRGNAKRDEEHRAEARQMGTQAAWLESAQEHTGAPGATTTPEPEPEAEPEPEPEPEAEPEPEPEPEPMTRAERRQAREAAEAVQPEPVVAAAGAAGAGWAGAAPDTDPEAEQIAKAAGFRDEVAADDALSEDIEIPANEWGGPRDEALDEEPTVENPVEDDLPAEAPEERVEHVAVVEEPTVENPVEDDLPEEAPEEPVEEAPEHPGRRISGFLELRDGGFGVGSAAPIEDGAQPLDHPVQAYRDTMTFRAPGDPGYDSAEPDVWFYDAGAAERSGFRPADG